MARWSGTTDLVAAEFVYNAVIEPDSVGAGRYDAGANVRVFDAVDKHRHSSFRGQIIGLDIRRVAAPASLDPGEVHRVPTDTRLYVIDARGMTFDQGKHTIGFAWGTGSWCERSCVDENFLSCDRFSRNTRTENRVVQ